MAEATILGTVIDVAIIVVAFVVLNYASNTTINNAVKVANITRLGKTAVGFTLIAFSTSLPELTVALTAAATGDASISIGNVLGSNIFNICIVVGLAGLLLYYLHARRQRKQHTEHKHIPQNIVFSLEKTELNSIYFGLFISSVIPLVLIFISEATWVVGLVLIGIFIGYMYQLSKVRINTQTNGKTTPEDKKRLKRYIASNRGRCIRRCWRRLFPCRISRQCRPSSWTVRRNNWRHHNCLRNKPARVNPRFESDSKGSCGARNRRRSGQQLH